MRQDYLHRARAFPHAAPDSGDATPRHDETEVNGTQDEAAATARERSLGRYERNEQNEITAPLASGAAQQGRGCDAHGVAAAVVTHWWWLMRHQEVTLTACPCCGGPVQPGVDRCRQCAAAGAELVDYLADRVPALHFTLHETMDIPADVAVLRRCRRLIEEHQPGANAVILTIVTRDRRRIRVEWRARASAILRRAIAQVLAGTAAPRATTAQHR